MLLTFLGTLLAVGVPFVLWPLAWRRIYQVLKLPTATVLGLLSGPLWFGWLLGLLVLLIPGGPLWAYTGILVTVPLAALATSKNEVTNEQLRRKVTFESVIVGLFLSTLVAFLVFNTLVYPPWDHDILVVQSFALRLKESWNFWGLPRYSPDELGFYYPLAHPPPMMSILAWMGSVSPLAWITRVPSAYLLAASFLALYVAGENLTRRAGAWTVVLILSSGLYLFFATNNSQDIFRFAGLAGALAIFPFAVRSCRAAMVTGAMLGLSASYHSLGLVFLVLLPGALAFAGGLKRESIGKGAAMLAAACIVGAYPYISNFLELRSVVIPTQVLTPVENVLAFMRDVQTSYSQTETAWDAWISARLAMFTTFATWGYAGLAFLLALAPWGYSLIRRKADRGNSAWTALVVACLGYLWVVIDPGDYLYSITGKRLIVNIRYPLAVLPVMAVAAGAGLAKLGGRRMLIALPLFIAVSVFALQPSHEYFSLRKKISFENANACVFCSDHEKLSGNYASGSYRAVRWLENLGDRNCLTFRESDYFAWSSTLEGVAYYHPIANHAFAVTETASTRNYLLGEGVNCIFLDNDSVIRKQVERTHPVFAALETDAAVVALNFYDVNVWMLDGPYERGKPERLESNGLAQQVADFALPPHQMAEIELEFTSVSPVSVVAYLDTEDGRRYRILIRQSVAPGAFKFAFANHVDATRLSFWFSDKVTITSAILQGIEPAASGQR